MDELKTLLPNWSAPNNVKAMTILKPSGLDLSLRNPNRNVDCSSLVKDFNLPAEPIWLKQIHTANAVDASKFSSTDTPEADASFTQSTNTICTVMTADCLPILLCDKKGKHVAAIHAGWRGQVAGVIEKTISALNTNPKDLLVWFGPAISSEVYEVGEDVYQEFKKAQTNLPMNNIFKQHKPGKWLLNLYLVAQYILDSLGVTEEQISGGDLCTYSDPKLFHSYRKEKENSGRLVSLIWLEKC